MRIPHPSPFPEVEGAGAVSYDLPNRRATAVAIETPARKRTGPGSQNTAGLDLDELRELWLKPLWLVLGDDCTAEPKTEDVPRIWQRRDVCPRIAEAGLRISAEAPERHRRM